MSSLQVIPDGYKQTEVGVIPNDWRASILGEFVHSLEAGISVNSVDKRDAFSHGKHILKTSCVSKGYFYPKEAKSIIPNDVSRAKTMPTEGAIIVSRMNTPDLVGELGFIDGIYTNLFLPDRLWQMRFRASVKTNTRWLAYILSFPAIAKKIKESATGTSNSMKNISKGSLLSVGFPSPEFEEQTAIANALSDVDALLCELEKLIAKKQSIKTATMQQLLTGKTRLPQFSIYADGDKQGQVKGSKTSELGEIPEDWKVKAIGELCEYQNGKAQEHYFNRYDGYKVVSIGNYSEAGHYVETGSYIHKQLKAEVGRFVLNQGDLAMILNDKTAIGTIIGKVLLIDEDDCYVMNQRTMRLTTKGEVLSNYLHSLINSEFIHKRIVGMAKPGTQIYVNTDDVLNFALPIPKSLEEQTAIAAIFTDMDEEIQALKQRLSKTRQIKQGMMQELLTGKTRLPFEKSGDMKSQGEPNAD